MPGKSCCCAAATVALVGASAIGVTPTTAPRPDLYLADIQLTADDIVIDIIRHADDLAPANERVPFSPEFPGAPISDLGQQQATATAHQIYADVGGPHHVAGLFSGPDLDAQDTAAPFATLEGMDPQILNGLVEVDGGIFADQPVLSLGGLYYDAAVILWMLGLVNAMQIPGADEFNGVVVNDNYTESIAAMYNVAMANPVVGDDGNITDVAYSSEASSMIWVMLNVQNPDPMALVDTVIQSLSSGGMPALIPNAGLVQIEGNPEDGWTLVSWAGNPVPENPGALGELFLLWRDLVVPPQVALDHMWDAVMTGDSAAVTDAFQDGMTGINAALDQIPDTLNNLFADLVAGTW